MSAAFDRRQFCKRAMAGSLAGLYGLRSGFAQDAAKKAADDPDRWEATIQAFEKQDAERPPAKGQNLFVGSSSIRLWKLDEAFPGRTCLNRGFGGSQLHEVARYAARLVLPYEPRVIVLYCGDNDLAQKRTAEQVRDSYNSFVQTVRSKLPESKLVWIAIKPSPKRWALRDAGRQANALVKAAQQDDPHSLALDPWDQFLGADGLPRKELYVKDELHLSPAGYAIWNEIVRPHLVTA